MMQFSDRKPLKILIASPLEAAEVARMAEAVAGHAVVVHRPELLAVPRYVADHDGIKRSISEAEKGVWFDLLADADILFDFDWLAPEQLTQTAPRLRWIQGTSAGLGEFVERTGLVRSSILITTAAGVHASALAEFTLLGLLYFRRNVRYLLDQQGSHAWQRYTNRELAGSRVLVVGLGAVGLRVARALAELGLEVWGCRRSPDSDLPAGIARLVTRAQLMDALPRLDALVLACPLTPVTRHMIGADELSALPPSAILINIGRGALVDEAALTRALREKRLVGAALDVFETEPLPKDSPLWDLPNVLVSPHSASTVEGENRRLVDLFIANFFRFVAGQQLINEYCRKRGY